MNEDISVTFDDFSRNLNDKALDYMNGGGTRTGRAHLHDIEAT